MPWTNASIVLNSRDATAGTYNSCKFNAVNQNIVQGQIHSVAVSEVNFPYDIPNIQTGYNVFEIFTDKINSPAGVVLEITVPPGFYNGTELADAINAAITAENVAQGTPVANAADLPLCVYNDTSNLFSFTLTAPVTAGLDWAFSSPYTYPTNLTGIQPNKLGKDIMSIMGFLPSQNGGNPILDQADPFVAAGAAPLAFTQYIDICSPQLCKFQRFRDGSTTNLARRADVICRLYISNNVAIQEQEGVRPLIINRQYFNARVMKWTADNSVGTIDIQLYDDIGQPLTTTWQPRPYQITFNAYESEDAGEAEGGDGLENLLRKHAAYQPRNEQAWGSSSYPMARK